MSTDEPDANDTETTDSESEPTDPEAEPTDLEAEPTTTAPDNMLERHPETAYFWGRVAGDGRITDEGSIELSTSDEDAARRLAAIAGDAQVDHRIAERDFAHDTAVTRAEDEYTVQIIDPSLAANAGAALGLPVGGDPGGYRFDTFSDYRRELIRGLLEACGVVCFRESANAVGISFVHDDERLLARIRSLLESEGFNSEEPQESSSVGYWFGVADEDTPAFGEWAYEGATETGLFATSRRRKTLRSVERAAGLEVGALVDSEDESAAGDAAGASGDGGD